MKPFSISTRREKAYDRSVSVVGFFNPFADLPAVWRIHPASSCPFTRKTIVLFTEKLRTFSVLFRSAYIQRKTKLTVQFFKKVFGCFPVNGLR